MIHECLSAVGGWTCLAQAGTEEAVAATAVGLAVVLYFACICLAIVLGLASTVFWIWMLVDLVTNEPPNSDQKVMWLLIVLLLQAVGALVYYFVRRPERIREFGK